MTQTQINFDAAERTRLNGQSAKVFEALSDGHWWTLAKLAEVSGASEAGASARIRDLRKPEFGSHVIEKRREENRFFYRMVS